MAYDRCRDLSQRRTEHARDVGHRQIESIDEALDDERDELLAGGVHPARSGRAMHAVDGADTVDGEPIGVGVAKQALLTVRQRHEGLGERALERVSRLLGREHAVRADVVRCDRREQGVRGKRRTAVIDQAAAAVLLQSWLEQQRS